MSQGADPKSELSLKSVGKPLVYSSLMQRESIGAKFKMNTEPFVWPSSPVHSYSDTRYYPGCNSAGRLIVHNPFH